MPTPAVVELDPSVLGTRQYWDHVYAREVKNFTENGGGDEGEVWFGEESEDRIVQYLDSHFESGDGDDSDGDDEGEVAADKTFKVLDLGTGNGHLLFTLHEQGYSHWRLHGIDYSSDSIELAKAIARHRSIDDITFEVSDFIKTQYGELGWDLILDKGTFDAICLSDEKVAGADGRTLGEVYPERVTRLLKPGGTLLVTSCNWTQEELVTKLTAQGSELVHTGQVKRPSFTFGGQTGSTLATVAFKRVDG